MWISFVLSCFPPSLPLSRIPRPHTCISSGCQGYRFVLRRLHVTSYTYRYRMRWRHESAVTAYKVTQNKRRLRRIHVNIFFGTLIWNTCSLYSYCNTRDQVSQSYIKKQAKFYLCMFESIYSMIQKDGLNFVRQYFLNYTWYVNDLHNIWKRRS